MDLLVNFHDMAILDMIPTEYWRQLRKELNALDWEAINSTEEAARQQAEQAEQERRAKAYDEAVKRRRRQDSRERDRQNGSSRKWVEAHREQINAYQRERYARMRAEKMAAKAEKPK